jgi:hypothetical protein
MLFRFYAAAQAQMRMLPDGKRLPAERTAGVPDGLKGIQA